MKRQPSPFWPLVSIPMMLVHVILSVVFMIEGSLAWSIVFGLGAVAWYWVFVLAKQKFLIELGNAGRTNRKGTAQ